MCCPCYTDDERGMVIISYGFESYHPLIIHYGSLPIGYLGRVAFSPIVNRILVHSKVNRDPSFQADQSSVVWSAPEFE